MDLFELSKKAHQKVDEFKKTKLKDASGAEILEVTQVEDTLKKVIDPLLSFVGEDQPKAKKSGD